MKRPHSNLVWLAVLAGLMVLAGAAALLLPRLLPKGTTVGIWLDGQCLERIDLSRVTEPYTFPLTGKSGLTNLVEVEPGRIRVREADCPDQICVDRGWLEADGQPIVCLPNTLVIQVEAPSGDAPDAVVGS